MYEIRFARPAERYLKKIKDKHLLTAFKFAVDKLKNTTVINDSRFC